AERRAAADNSRRRPGTSLIVRVAEIDVGGGRCEDRPCDVKPIDTDHVRVARDSGPGRRAETGCVDAGRTRPGGDVFLVVRGDAAVQNGVVVLDEVDGPIAGLARVACSAAARGLRGRRTGLDPDARPRPGEAAVRR